MVNGDVFRWNWMWARIAEWFGLRPAPFPGQGTPLERQLTDAAPAWRGIARRHGLTEPALDRLASAWHTDAGLGRPIEVVTDMGKSRKLGFLDYQATAGSFFDLFNNQEAVAEASTPNQTRMPAASGLRRKKVRRVVRLTSAQA